MRLGVVSGKGGTGKTTVSYSLAVALRRKGFRVGLLDIDLTGPNLHDILRGELEVSEDSFVPAQSHGLVYVSLGQIASEGDPVLWNGGDLEAAARQLLDRTTWGELDYLIVDFPPGSGPEVQALLPLMDCAIVVTVPSMLAESNVRRIIEMCRETSTPIAGVVKNMAWFVCPNCGAEHRIFPDDTSFEDLGVRTIAKIPLDPRTASLKMIKDFPIEAVMQAVEQPVVLAKRKKSIRRVILEALAKNWAAKPGKPVKAEER
ncbi:MAG: ATP-binding protein [Deltaproteobacteria bacterium]|nr:ATP-binding protein [Deltaproteobacteria bacterium]